MIYMENAADLLLIIVSAVLSVFLIVLIMVLILIMKVLRDIKRLTSKAEHVIDSVESAASFFERTTPAVALFKSFAKIVETVTNKKGK